MRRSYHPTPPPVFPSRAFSQGCSGMLKDHRDRTGGLSPIAPPTMGFLSKRMRRFSTEHTVPSATGCSYPSHADRSQSHPISLQAPAPVFPWVYSGSRRLTASKVFGSPKVHIIPSLLPFSTIFLYLFLLEARMVLLD
ncbi:hypothetical protein CONLIGDRAFT_145345 [Coniochaeta ligniaria NRRL 30616]|uniref:Uncharacterized protein n=1 Tax=Coniochaeta ligniaria NRRL 30616 TaxID=1408157 RepID=A0A1J7J635_9PEZI|nr:hypothetical protein CONLIGDRAFT_145345 [Coniochaeta ligniaria NRRL 30616]